MDPANVLGFVILVLIIAAVVPWANKRKESGSAKGRSDGQSTCDRCKRGR